MICVTFISKLSPILKHFLQIAQVTSNLFDLCITGDAALKPKLPLYHPRTNSAFFTTAPEDKKSKKKDSPRAFCLIKYHKLRHTNAPSWVPNWIIVSVISRLNKFGISLASVFYGLYYYNRLELIWILVMKYASQMVRIFFQE